MAYFTLDKPTLFMGYPFDFHSHFAGILPVESRMHWSAADWPAQPIPLPKGRSTAFQVAKGQELSLIGLLMAKNGVHPDAPHEAREKAREAAHYELFELALQRTIARNPFLAFDKEAYLRGECAAESTYLACAILLQRFGNLGVAPAIDQPDLYRAVVELLRSEAVRDAETFELVRYFNRKIWTANKYTPFDDAYWTRGIIRERHTELFAGFTLCFLREEGIAYTQTATGEDEIDDLNALFAAFNQAHGTAYRLLAHTAHGYTALTPFNKDLAAIRTHFELDGDTPKSPTLVGIDLLGAETRTGFYRDFFTFVLGSLPLFKSYADKNPDTRKVVLHIHCGEGTGISDNNRSLCGYFLRNATHVEPAAFYRNLCAYAYKCYANTLLQGPVKQRDKRNRGLSTDDHSALAGLFDELFQDNSLTVAGLRLRRFDITSATTQSLVAYYARTNIMNLSRALDAQDGQGPTNYERLTEPDSPFTLRIGHAYHYRNYIASKYPALLFDTNLGSNFITGAAGLFDSAQAYRLNRGLRHLNGFIGTDVLRELIDAVAYQGEERLDQSQIDYVYGLTAGEAAFHQGMQHFPQHLPPGTPAAIGDRLRFYFQQQCDLHRPLCEGKGYPLLQLYLKLFAQVLNWRSYLLGADGQGVEHSNVQDEAMRMSILLNYGLASREGRILEASLENTHRLFVALGKAYWDATIGTPGEPAIALEWRRLSRLEGFESPDSVVLIESRRI